MERLPFKLAVKQFFVDNEYIQDTWRFEVIDREIIGKSDWAKICCEVYKPRKRKPYYIIFKYNFVREQIKTDTIQVDGFRD